MGTRAYRRCAGWSALLVLGFFAAGACGQTATHSTSYFYAAPGTYTVTFKVDVDGWTPPADKQVEVLEDQLTQATGLYIQQASEVNPVWVSYTNGSDTGLGTWDSPVKRLAQGWEKAIDGGTIILMGDEPLEGVLRLGGDGKTVRIEVEDGVVARVGR